MAAAPLAAAPLAAVPLTAGALLDGAAPLADEPDARAAVVPPIARSPGSRVRRDEGGRA